ncbi:MAG: DNA repair protein RecN (Recombination protein N) [Chloroflexi bacterium]|nr:MAG: DNA repair protein RecN (Recombination protein N) [Chloroflexota bacterium]
MLDELRIENFAIIQSLEIRFKDGLIIFTGETGAGKSIILDAIEALVGGRVDATMVRSGSDRAALEAVFKIPAQAMDEVTKTLKREELYEGGHFITLGREIRGEGRSIARVNGRNVNVGLLKELGKYLVDIHGQSEHLSLLDVHSHLGLLDRYACSEVELDAYKKTYRELLQIRKELNELRELERESARRTELLAFQAQEIEAAQLKPGEEEDLDQERSRLANAENLSVSTQQALVLLDEGSPEAPSATDLIGQASQLLFSLAKIDPSQETLATQAESLNAQLTEINRDLRGYLDRIEFNPRRLEQVENRLDLIHQMKRKYGGSVESAIEYGKNTRLQLENIANASERIADLETSELAAIEDAKRTGEALSTKRKQAAENLSTAVEIELADLSMVGARFSVSFVRDGTDSDSQLDKKETASFSESGIDQVEFLIAPNPGEGLKPLVKIASGGETSRLMLALKNVLASVDFIPTLVFDEIDQGIGGRVGFVVGEKLWHLGVKHQVMCVTHLSQLAAFGDQHFRVRKQVVSDRTITEVEELDDTARIVELAQMTGSMSESNLNAAQEILSKAHERQLQLKEN